MQSRSFRSPKTRWLTASALIVALASGNACGGAGVFVWVDDVPEPWLVQRRDPNLIEEGDLLDIRVYGQPDLSTRSRVRADGTLTLPLTGSIDARHRSPGDLEVELKKRLEQFLRAPSVVVAIEETSKVRVSVMGEIAHPGVFSLEPNASVLEAIAAAGGFTEYADKDRIYVLRKGNNGASSIRIRFTYDRLVQGQGRSADFLLQSQDTVVIE